MSTSVENDFSWILGEDSALSHIRLIDRGAAGEVHEVFARKVLRPFGQITIDDILNEVRAVKKLCNGDNINIVRVTNHGTIQRSFYFIDMELCNHNLETYMMELQWLPTAEVWDIMKDVANGLTYIHAQSQVHRDLKPRNSSHQIFKVDCLVLYSKHDQLWKVGDFGLTAEGTSKKKWTTRYMRGTSSYRAPELIREQHFTNKVDIFAFGCILFEAAFSEKAFRDDFYVDRYASGSDLVYPTTPQSVRNENDVKEVKALIEMALDVDPSRRPKAQELHQTLFALGTRERSELDLRVQEDGTDDIGGEPLNAEPFVEHNAATDGIKGQIREDKSVSKRSIAIPMDLSSTTDLFIPQSSTPNSPPRNRNEINVDAALSLRVREPVEGDNQGLQPKSVENEERRKEKRNDVIRGPYYLSTNAFNSRIAILGATADGDYAAQLWDPQTMKIVWEWPIHREKLAIVDPYPGFSPDGIYVGFYVVGAIQVLDTMTGREIESVSVSGRDTLETFAVGPNGRIAVGRTSVKGPYSFRNGDESDLLVLTPREQKPRIFYTHDGKQIFVVYISESSLTSTGIEVKTLRVDTWTIESAKRKALFKFEKVSSYVVGGTITLEDKDCVVLDIKFSEPEKSGYGERYERRVVALSSTSKIRDLRVFTKDRDEQIIVSKESVISVGWDGIVKRYGKSGPTVLAELRIPETFVRSRTVACDDERITLRSPDGRLEVLEFAEFDLKRLAAREKLARRQRRLPTADESVLELMNAAQM